MSHLGGDFQDFQDFQDGIFGAKIKTSFCERTRERRRDSGGNFTAGGDGAGPEGGGEGCPLDRPPRAEGLGYQIQTERRDLRGEDQDIHTNVRPGRASRVEANMKEQVSVHARENKVFP